MPKPSASALRTDILARPSLTGFRTAGSDGGIASWYAASDETGPRTGSFLTEMGIYRVLGPTAGETFLASLEVAAVTNPVVKRTLNVVKNGGGVGNSESGLDFGHPLTQAFLAQLAAGGVISTESKDALVAFASRPWSRAERLWGEGVVITSDDVATALRG